jgi:hypothetical protein
MRSVQPILIVQGVASLLAFLRTGNKCLKAELTSAHEKRKGLEAVAAIYRRRVPEVKLRLEQAEARSSQDQSSTAKAEPNVRAQARPSRTLAVTEAEDATNSDPSAGVNPPKHRTGQFSFSHHR